MALQESGQMYLETIYVLSKANPHVRSVDISEHMGYSKPSVSRAVHILKEENYIEMDADGYITLTEGKYHQIKLMAEAVHNQITYLERVTFGPILLDESLERGQWRYLTEEEEKALEDRGKNLREE